MRQEIYGINRIIKDKGINNMGYRLGIYFTIMHYPVDPVLDEMINVNLDSGIDSIDFKGSFNTIIKFKNGISMDYWNTNKYYAWMSEGLIGGYLWKDCRPKRRTMVRFIDEMIKHVNEK